MRPKSLPTIILATSALLIAGCNGAKKPEEHLIRIIDRLSDEAVVRSPFQEILNEFNPVQEDLTGRWKYIPELSGRDTEIWGVSTAYPPLAKDRLAEPENMHLLWAGKEVPFLGQAQPGSEAWKWLATNESLELKPLPDFDSTSQGIRLEEGKSLEFEKLLPDGETIIDIYLLSSAKATVEPRLKISFNGEEVETLGVKRRNWLKIRKATSLGVHEIKIEHLPSGKKASGSSALVIGTVRISNSSDIIIFSRKRIADAAPPQGTFQLRYFTFQEVPETGRDPVPPSSRRLYYLQGKFPIYDRGITSNPFHMIKKMRRGDLSINFIAAPTPTELTVPVRVPDDGVLEFSSGFYDEFDEKPQRMTVEFKIMIRDGGRDTLLWSREINSRDDAAPEPERVDLSSYGGKTVSLTFTTEEIGSSRGRRNSLSVPIWINPIIYKPAQKEDVNVILISLDTVRSDHLGCYGYSRPTSPGVDALAGEGILFSNVYSTTSWTLPAHISMLTSLTCGSHHVYYPHQKMSPDLTTLADVLRTSGFYTAAFTGGGYLSETYGFSKGFDRYHELRLFGDKGLRLDEAERLAELSADWLNKNKDKRFFLFLHTYQPHDPYANLSAEGKTFLAPEARWNQIKMESLFENNSRFETNFTAAEKQNIIDLYDGEIRYTDALFVQSFVRLLKQLNLYDRSLIVLVSDHGEEFYDHESWLHDHSIYEEAIRVPLIVKLPGSSHQGQRIDSSVRLTDVMPTILDLSGSDSRKLALDGRSLMPLISGKEKAGRSFVADVALRDGTDLFPSIIAVSEGRFKLILDRTVRSPYVSKTGVDINGTIVELYDLESDPKETTNLAGRPEHRELCFRLLESISVYMNKLESRPADENIVMDENLRERLRALGYIK